MFAPAHQGPLLSTHDTLEQLFSRMVRAAHAGDWRTCDDFSERFAIALDVHLRHEETVEFPRYRATSTPAAVEVEQFVAEHGRIRRSVGRLLLDLRERTLDLEQIGGVELLIREHDSHESERFLPWFERFGRC